MGLFCKGCKTGKKGGDTNLDRYTSNMILSSGKYAEERSYWLDKLGGDWSMSGFPADRLRRDDHPYRRADWTGRLEGEAFAALNRVNNGSAQAWYMTLLLGVKYLLYRYTGSEDIVMGMPAFRSAREGQAGGASGNAPTTTPTTASRTPMYALRTAIGRSDTARDLLLRIKDVVSEARKHRNISYEMILDQAGDGPLFHTAALLKNIHALPDPEHLQADTLFLFDWQPDGVEVTVLYNKCLYEHQTIEQIGTHLLHLLTLVSQDFSQAMSALDILTESERHDITTSYNDTAFDYPKDMTLHRLFTEQAQRTPDRLAVIGEQGSLTYRELDEASNRCARYLIAHGIRPRDQVGVIAGRALDTVVYVFGILKAGAAYVPLEPDTPEERKEHVLHHSDCRLLLHPGDYERQGMESYDTAPLAELTDAESLAYVVYTSGSTGVPKGVATAHRAVVNTLLDINGKFRLTEQDRVIGISSLCFDLSVYDIFGTLATGAALVLVPDQRDIPHVIELVLRHGVTVWNTVPALLDLAVQHLDTAPAETQLRLFLLSGDWIPVSLFGKVETHFPEARMIALGGATEAAIWSIHYPVTHVDPHSTSLPYGMPLGNQQVYVLNQDLQPCPYDVEGQICIGGDGVAVGYYNDPQRTADSFTEHPRFGRLYQTGDYGVFTRHGYIKLHGRRDFQIKIRGFRIEIQEIQAALLRFTGIRDAVVTARGENAADKHLCAYLIADRDLTVQELRDFLADSLPDYMIPSYFMRLERLPLSPNGKVNLNDLPVPEREHSLLQSTAYAPPRNEIEAKIVQVWQEVLGLEPIGIYDNFFTLGGDSMKALKVIAKLSVDYTVEANDMFERQTVARFAERLYRTTGNLRKRVEMVKQFDELIENEEAAASQQHRVDEYRERNRRYEDLDLTQNRPYRHLLLTGATGYLGNHLLQQLLEGTDARLTLLVRGRDEADAQRRLLQKVEYYHGPEWLTRYEERVRVVKGDITAERLGLTEAAYGELSEQVDGIFHTAANVKHYGRYEEFHGPNVRGVEEVIRFARAGGVSKDIHHICTVGLGSGMIENQVFAYFTEYDTDIGQINNNFYHRTKMEAERLLTQARDEHGLNVNIYRMGALVFESHSGKFQENIADNEFYDLIRSAVRLGTVPRVNTFLMDFTFVDYASRAILKLHDRTELRNETYHILNPNVVGIAELADLMSRHGHGFESMPLEHYFDDLIVRHGDHPDSEWVETIFRFLGIFASQPSLTRFHILADKTVALLRRLDFEWPELTAEHVGRMIDHSRKVNFL